MPYKRRPRFWWTFFYPSAGTVFSKEGVFQQPRLFTSTIGKALHQQANLSGTFQLGNTSGVPTIITSYTRQYSLIRRLPVMGWPMSLTEEKTSVWFFGLLEKHVPVKVFLAAIVLMALPYLVRYVLPSPDRAAQLGKLSADAPLDLDILIRKVKQELAAAEQESVTNREAALFELKQFDLELSFVMRARSLGSGKVEYVPVVVTNELELGSERVQRITLHMNAVPPVSGSNSVITGHPQDDHNAELIGHTPKKGGKP
jgi:hypothetical protein